MRNRYANGRIRDLGNGKVSVSVEKFGIVIEDVSREEVMRRLFNMLTYQHEVEASSVSPIFIDHGDLGFSISYRLVGDTRDRMESPNSRLNYLNHKKKAHNSFAKEG